MSLEDKLFVGVVSSVLGLFLSDAVYILTASAGGKTAQFWNAFFHILYDCFSATTGILWFIYVEFRIYQDIIRIRKKIAWYILPYLVLIALVIFSPLIRGDIVSCLAVQFQHGRFAMFLEIVVLLYILFAAGIALIATIEKERKHLKTEYYMLAKFSIFPMIGGVLEYLIDAYPFLWIGIMLSVLLIFINLQNQQINKDGLTGINNRMSMDRHLNAKIYSKYRKKKLYFILMDIDSFKHINDTYGHTVGDEAIVRISEILKKVCCMKNDFLARYGGDEFAIICERTEKKEVEELLKQIEYRLELSNRGCEYPYKIRLSCGYAELGESEEKNQDQLIILADKRLYEVKRTKKK